ncbi:MAG: DUF5110 domain-containing protein, partial [Chloroflexus sp.]
PLFARAGAVIPLWPEAPVSTMGYYPPTIELHLFVPQRDGVYTSELHEDDGLTFDFRHGACYRTTFWVERRGQQLLLHAAVDGHGFAAFTRETFTLVIHGAQPATVTIDGATHPLTNGRVTFANRGQGFVAVCAI